MSKQTLKSVGLWIATVLSTAVFVAAGVSKLANGATAAQQFSHFGYPGWFAYVIGASELVGALLLVVPRTASFGALALGGVMIGAFGTHLRAGQPLMALVPLGLMALLSAVGWARREGVARLFRFKLPRPAQQTAR